MIFSGTSDYQFIYIIDIVFNGILLITGLKTLIIEHFDKLVKVFYIFGGELIDFLI